MKKLLYSAFLLMGMVSFAQAQTGNVGVNTTLPTNTLDVNGTARVRTLAVNPDPASGLVVDANGVIGINPARFVMTSQSVASSNVDVPFTIPSAFAAANTYNKVLGITTSVTVPAKTKYAIVTSYSVPAGFSTVAGIVKETGSYGLYSHQGTLLTNRTTTARPVNYAGYIGVSFFRNSVLVDAATRKVTAPTLGANTHFAMTTVGGQYYEVVDNSAGTSAITVTYSLGGYLEILGYSPEMIEAGVITTGTARFNMWDAGTNYNWGRGSMVSTVYQMN